MSDPPSGIGILRIGLRHVGLLEFVQQDDLLWRAPLLACLDEATRTELVGRAKARSVESGKEILAEDAQPAALHFLIEGSVVLSTGGGSIDLATLSKGDFFGLGAVFPEALQAAATAAAGIARMALLPPDPIVRLARAVPSFGRLLARAAKERRDRSKECSDFLDRW